jgi:type III pantothenate kinase
VIIAFDVGNTETTVALFDGEQVRAHWRLTTSVPRTPDEYRLLLSNLLGGTGVSPSYVLGSAICSVVPPVTQLLQEVCAAAFGRQPVIVDARSKLPIRLEVDEPFTVGADRVANTLAATILYRRDTIIVDVGTATTYDVITGDGSFIGGVIQPGVGSSAETLFRRTAQLAATELIPPAHVIGTRTDECIRSGVLYGAVDSIDGIVARIVAEWGVADPLVIATGGLAATLKPFCRSFHHVDPFLTLQGVRLAYEIIRAHSNTPDAMKVTGPA